MIFMKIRREVKVGFLVLVSLVILLWGLNFLKGRNLLGSGNAFYGIYSRVDGLTEGSPIFYKGFKVGTVREIMFHPTRPGYFLVTFSISQPIALNDKYLAQIYSLDLMGSKGVQIVESKGERLLVPGDTIRTSVMGDIVDKVSMEVLPLKDKTERLIVKLDSVLTDIGSIFSEENRRGIENSIKNLTLISARIQQSLDAEGDLGKSFNNIEGFTSSLKMQKENLDIITSNLALFSNQLNQSNLAGVVASTDSTLNALNILLNKASNGEGSLGMMLTDKSIYHNVKDASANLDRLFVDIRHNPERYLHFSAINFGRKEVVNVDESLALEKGIVFKVRIAQSETPLEIKNSLVLDDKYVFEDFNGDYYIYTVGETTSYTEALKLCDTLQSIYPSATVISYKDGKIVRLKNALRKIDVKN